MPRKDQSWVEMDGKGLSVSSLDKVLWDEDGYTKGDLIQYLMDVSPYMLPHLKDRPLSLRRYPDGIRGKSFYQKQLMQGAPEWVETYKHRSGNSQRDIDFVLAHDRAALAWLGNQACIEIHPWLSRRQSWETPDFAVIDLDPDPPSGFKEAIDVAKVVHEALKHLGVEGFVKTSGVDGLHIYVPLAPGRYSHRDAVNFSLFVGNLVVETMPGKATLERTVKNRLGRIYIDCYQNGAGKTVAAPYCPRPVAGATVSTPVGWDELNVVKPGDFTIRTVLQRLEQQGDIFRRCLGLSQEIAPVLGLAGRKTSDDREKWGLAPVEGKD